MIFVVVSDRWILYHYLRLVTFLFLLDLDLLEKNLSVNLFSQEFVCRPNWFTISDSQSRRKFMIGIPVKFPIRNFVPNQWNVSTDNKIRHLVDFLMAVGNNIRELFLIFDSLYWPFNAAFIACFLYFNNSIFSVSTPLAFDNDNVSLIEIFRSHNWVPFAIFFFSASKLKVNSYIKIFIENQLPVNSNQIHVSVTVRSMKCLPPKIGGRVFFPSYVILDSSDLTITRSSNLEQFC